MKKTIKTSHLSIQLADLRLTVDIRLIACRQPLVQAEQLERVEFIKVCLGQIGAILDQKRQGVYVAIETSAMSGREPVLARFQVHFRLLELDKPVDDFGASTGGCHVEQVSAIPIGHLVTVPALLSCAQKYLNVTRLGHESV